MDDDEFNALVNDDIRGLASQSGRDYLRSPAVVERWHSHLLHLKRKVEHNLSAKKAEMEHTRIECLARPNGREEWLKAKAAASKWRESSMYFRNGVEDRLDEAKRVLRQIRQADPLREAIKHHRELVEADEDPQIADEQLWSVLGDD